MFLRSQQSLPCTVHSGRGLLRLLGGLVAILRGPRWSGTRFASACRSSKYILIKVDSQKGRTRNAKRRMGSLSQKIPHMKVEWWNSHV